MDILSINIGMVREGLQIYVSGRTHPQANDYWDANWLSVKTNFVFGQFSGSIPCDIRSEELVIFKNQVQSMYQNLIGTAEFTTMEGCIGLKLTGNRLGQIAGDGYLLDQPGIGNRLAFTFQMDQSFLPPLLRELEVVCNTYPVLGVP